MKIQGVENTTYIKSFNPHLDPAYPMDYLAFLHSDNLHRVTRAMWVVLKKYPVISLTCTE